MAKTKLKPNPTWKKARRWSLLWLLIFTSIALLTVLPFEVTILPQVFSTPLDAACISDARMDEMTCHITTHANAHSPYSDLTRVPFFGTLMGIALFLVPLFYLLPATLLSFTLGAMTYREWRRMPYWEVTMSVTMLLAAVGLAIYLYGTPHGDYYFIWLLD